MREQTVESYDKTKIAFNHFTRDGRDAVIVLCHGFWMSKDAKPFLDLSKDFFNYYNVITMDQRGHGNSGGAFSFTSQEHEDIRAVIQYAKKIYTRIYLIGFSLGAASSIIYVAQEKDVHGLMVVSPPMSFEEIENRFLDKGALIPAIKKFGPHVFKLRLGPVNSEKIKPADVIDQIAPIPLLIMFGEKDPIISKKHAETLYERAKNPKQIIMIKNGLHAEDLYRLNRNDFMRYSTSWVDEIQHG